MKKVQSLSKKIVFSIAVISILTILAMINIFEKINREAFYTVEMEKADLIVNTIEPLIALNIYLNMNDKIDKTIFQFVQNPNILAVKVLKNNVVINEIASKEYKSGVGESFIIKKTIFQPNSKKEIGTLILVYSTKNYEKLISKYNKVLIESFFVFSIFFLLFSLYVKRLLSPLRKIAESLKKYSPNQKIDIPLITQNNEIGLISNALIDMQNNILEYSHKQEDINNYLEKKVNEKTLELRKQLYTNSLTGIPNRLSLLNTLKNSNEAALLMINIDDFKEINDFFGHMAGDYILIMLSRMLNNLFEKQEGVTFIHLSGDEFAILFVKKPLIDEFIRIAQTLVYDIEKMIFPYESNELSVRITIGGVFQKEKALEKADIALKLAKK
ncbi:MAG: diguanylate cyclase [Thiovulaceae bacterium]|nr:diguanylate cyclase [Sulfurimonadaceae bacterium]